MWSTHDCLCMKIAYKRWLRIYFNVEFGSCLLRFDVIGDSWPNPLCYVTIPVFLGGCQTERALVDFVWPLCVSVCIDGQCLFPTNVDKSASQLGIRLKKRKGALCISY